MQTHPTLLWDILAGRHGQLSHVLLSEQNGDAPDGCPFN